LCGFKGVGSDFDDESELPASASGFLPDAGQLIRVSTPRPHRKVVAAIIPSAAGMATLLIWPATVGPLPPSLSLRWHNSCFRSRQSFSTMMIHYGTEATTLAPTPIAVRRSGRFGGG